MNLDHILDQNTLKPFVQIQNKFNIPTADHYLYLQISHFLNSLTSPEIFVHKQSQYFINKPPSVNETSLFYNLLQNKLIFHKATPYLKWKTDLGKSFTTYQWQSAFKSIYKASKCTNHWELSHKIALRWYLTPYRISKFLVHNPTLLERLWNGGTDYAYFLVM